MADPNQAQQQAIAAAKALKEAEAIQTANDLVDSPLAEMNKRVGVTFKNPPHPETNPLKPKVKPASPTTETQSPDTPDSQRPAKSDD